MCVLVCVLLLCECLCCVCGCLCVCSCVVVVFVCVCVFVCACPCVFSMSLLVCRVRSVNVFFLLCVPQSMPTSVRSASIMFSPPLKSLSVSFTKSPVSPSKYWFLHPSQLCPSNWGCAVCRRKATHPRVILRRMSANARYDGDDEYACCVVE